MNVCKVKRNSMGEANKYQPKEYSNRYDKNIIKNNFTRLKLLKNNKINSKINNHLYIKSEFNIQKNSNEQSSSLTLKSLPSHIVKKQYFITPIKKENNSIINKITPETKTEKNEDSLSTFPLTKESMIITPQKNIITNQNSEEDKNNLRSLSCAQRTLKKNGKSKEGMIFVKKKIQGNLKNSFILTKTDTDTNENNSCCFFGEYHPQQMKFNPNNSMDYGYNNYYNKNYII